LPWPQGPHKFADAPPAPEEEVDVAPPAPVVLGSSGAGDPLEGTGSSPQDIPKAISVATTGAKPNRLRCCALFLVLSMAIFDAARAMLRSRAR
jgi:hypothetical protein